MGPPAAGPLLATPAHGVGHAQWASNGRRSHGSRAGPFGKGSVVARPAYRLGAKLPWNKEPDPTLPGPPSRRRQSPWFGSQSIRRPAESVSQSGPYGGSVWPVGRVRRRPRHHPLGSPLLWCTAAGCGGPSGAPRSLSVRVIMSMVGSRRRRGGSVKQKLAALRQGKYGRLGPTRRGPSGYVSRWLHSPGPHLGRSGHRAETGLAGQWVRCQPALGPGRLPRQNQWAEPGTASQSPQGGATALGRAGPSSM